MRENEPMHGAPRFEQTLVNTAPAQHKEQRDSWRSQLCLWLRCMCQIFPEALLESSQDTGTGLFLWIAVETQHETAVRERP